MNLELLQYDDSRTLAKKRREILSSAKELFIEKGIEQTSMQMIAERAGITRRSLYNYYDSKEKIAVDVQIVNLDEISWFSGWDFRGAESLEKGMADAFMNNLKKAFGDFQRHYLYIIRFDTYFCNGYPDNKYVDFLQGHLSAMMSEAGDMDQSLLMDIWGRVNLLTGYLHRMILRAERKPQSYQKLEEEGRLFSSLFLGLK